MSDNMYPEFVFPTDEEIDAIMVESDGDFAVMADFEGAEVDSLSSYELAAIIHSEEEQMKELRPTDVAWYEQITADAEIITIEGFRGGRHYFRITMPNHFGFPFVEAEMADKMVLRRYELHEDVEMTEIQSDLRTLRPTIAWKSSKNDAVAVTLYDNEGGTMVPRSWNDLRHFTINMMKGKKSLVSKMFKRVPTFNVRSYLYGTFDVVRVEETDADIIRDREMSLSVKVIPTPDDLFGEKGVDGSAFIRESVRDMLIDRMVDRMSTGAHADPVKAEKLARKFRKGYVFDTGRGVFSEGMMKAKFLVAKDEKLEADIVIYDCNIKSEITRNDNRITFTMNLKKQGKRVRTNRQIFSLFGEWIYGSDLHLIVDAYNEYVNHVIERFTDGTFVPSTEDKGGYSLNDMANRWIEARGSINESQYLLKMMRQAHIKTQSPERDDERRMPVPFAAAFSIRTQAEMMHLLGEPATMEPHQIKLTHWGFVLGDDIMVDVLEILGGADLDDTAELHFRVAATDSPEFNVRQGEHVAVIIRNPVGVSSNGTDVGIEYWVAPVANPLSIVRKYGEFFPEIDLRKGSRPNTISELNIDTAPTLVDEDQTSEHTEYTKRFVFDAWVRATEVSPNIIYGRHVNLMMMFKKYNIEFGFIAPEETFVDIATQTQNPDLLKQMGDINEEHTKYLVREINVRDLGIDPVDVARLSLKGVNNIEEGITTEFIAHHKAGVDFFDAAAQAHIEEQFELYRDENVSPLIVPEGVDAAGRQFRIAPAVLSEALQEERRTTGFRAMPQHVRDAMGNRVYDIVSEKYGEFAPQFAYEALMAALYQRENVFDGYESQDMVERGLYYGRMFDVLLEGFQSMRPVS